MSAFKLDAYAVLDLQPGVPESDIKKTYRTKSLLIHPDKTSNPMAPDAFDRLKKAQTTLMDEKERGVLDEAIADARMLLMREKKLTQDDEEVKSAEFAKEWREKTKVVLIDNELRKRKQAKAQMREEGRACSACWRRRDETALARPLAATETSPDCFIDLNPLLGALRSIRCACASRLLALHSIGALIIPPPLAEKGSGFRYGVRRTVKYIVFPSRFTSTPWIGT